MRKFVVSDLHGNGNIYNSIMSYLNNINQKEPVTLYIVGDLIDHGYDAPSMLLDIINRDKNDSFKVVYLAGDHEALMYQSYRGEYKEDNYRDWHSNGGWATSYGLEDYIKDEKDYDKIIDYISNLNIYEKLDEKINGKNIVLVHAACPEKVNDICNLKIKDDNLETYTALTAFKSKSIVPVLSKKGNDDYFTILGHIPNDDKYGCVYNKIENCLNIDGGSGLYVNGFFEYDHVPLIEIEDGYLKILTFNNKNEITKGCFFDGNVFYKMCDVELNRNREPIDKSVKVKKLIRNCDGVILYKE